MLGHCPKERKTISSFRNEYGDHFSNASKYSYIYSNEYIQVIVERASQLPSLIWFLQTHTHTTCIFRQKPFGNEIKKNARFCHFSVHQAIRETHTLNDE